MNVRDLKKLLENAPDDALVMVPGHDHSYREAHCELTTGLKEGRNQWTEDYGEETTPEAEYGKRLPILLIGA
jgi:hypothetical protein